MAYMPRSTSIFPAGIGSLRQPSASATSSQQNSALQARINVKRAELENLRQLRDLSGTLAGQMTQLQEKLETLRDGTEAIACVLSNWDNVLRAISLASGDETWPSSTQSADERALAKFPPPSDKPEVSKGPSENESTSKLPQTLVRVPVAPQAESIQKQEPP